MTFVNDSSTDIKLLKTLGRLLRTLLKAGLPTKNVIKPLVKNVLILVGLTAAASEADTGIHKIFLEQEHNEMEDIIKIVEPF